MTTKETFQTRLKEVRFDDLSPNFRDAVTITRRLGIGYLWIDSLCIIQDDRVDWEINAPRIGEYFKMATLNIVAGKKDASGILVPRIPPRFAPVGVNKLEDMHIGWLGTEAYCDPRGLDVERYPDAWKYQSPPHTRAWTMQEMRLARRNLVFQAEDDWSPHPTISPQLLTSQVYMQCQQEVRWENGRARQAIRETSADWYNLVEEYSGRQLTFESDRLEGFSTFAMNHSRISQGECGHYLAGLWAGDLFRGLLWRAQDERHRPSDWLAPSWSWAKGTGKVKHVWPTNGSVVAKAFESSVKPLGHNPWGRVQAGHILIQSALVDIEPVNGALTAWKGDIEVNVLLEEGCTAVVRIRYFFDHISPFDDADTSGQCDMYAFKITRRVALLLKRANFTPSVMERVGLMIVAKPDTRKWALAGTLLDVKIV
jgi:hypothetical protein